MRSQTFLALASFPAYLLLLPACSGRADEDPLASTDSEPPRDGDDLDSGVTDTDPTSFLAANLTITEIGVFQGVKVSIERDGAKVTPRKAPVLAGREGIFRVYVRPESGFAPGSSITAWLTLTRGGDMPTRVVQETKTISGPSSEAALGSTFNLAFAADDVFVDTWFSVMLTVPPGTPEQAPGPRDGAHFPSDGGTEELQAVSAPTFKLKIVPVKYNADGSGRLPDTSDGQVASIKNRLRSVFPVADIDLSVRDPWSYGGAISRSTGWSSFLQALLMLRQSDGAPKDVFYYGLVAPASSFGTYCSSGCVEGIAPLTSSPTDTVGRGAVGLGFSGDTAGGVAQQELAHAFGREHAPCGVSGSTDPAYPYPGGNIGSWGYDVVAKSLKDPTKYADIMSYCRPTWVSDYTFAAIFKRLSLIYPGS